MNCEKIKRRKKPVSDKRAVRLLVGVCGVSFEQIGLFFTEASFFDLLQFFNIWRIDFSIIFYRGLKSKSTKFELFTQYTQILYILFYF